MELSQVEMSKTSDSMVVEYGFTLIDLLKAVQKQKLEENEQIKSFKKMFEMQKQSEARARAVRATPSTDLIMRMLDEAKALGSAQIKQDGKMTFDYFL